MGFRDISRGLKGELRGSLEPFNAVQWFQRRFREFYGFSGTVFRDVSGAFYIILGALQGLSRGFQEIFKELLNAFQRYSKELRVFQDYHNFTEVSEAFEKVLRVILKSLQDPFEGVTSGFRGI